MKHAVSLNKINGKFHLVTASDETILRHATSDNRYVLPNGEYEHAFASILGNSISFNPMKYRPSAYPDSSIYYLDVYNFDDGKEQKVWAIKETEDNKAHVFYQNDHTEQRLVYQLVDLNIKSMSSRISQKLQEDYKLNPNQHDFDFTDRNLTYIPF